MTEFVKTSANGATYRLIVEEEHGDSFIMTAVGFLPHSEAVKLQHPIPKWWLDMERFERVER